MSLPDRAGTPRPLVAAGVALGVGLGGMLDGIVLHELLQWHSMLSSVVPRHDLAAMHVNMFWDGMFHALMWLVTAAGLALFWRASRAPAAAWSGRLLAAGMLAGWGAFNLVEGLIDHQWLGLHHVKPGPTQLAWDLGYLASGVVLLLVAAIVGRAPAARAITRRPRTEVPA